MRAGLRSSPQAKNRRQASPYKDKRPLAVNGLLLLSL